MLISFFQCVDAPPQFDVLKKSKKVLPGLRAKLFSVLIGSVKKYLKNHNQSPRNVGTHPRMWQCAPERGDACHVPEHGIVGLLQVVFFNKFFISQK